MRGHVLAVGEALIDIVHAADGSVTEHAGGSVANVAVALARLGERAHLATWIGDDVHGRRIAEWLAASGVAVVPGSVSAARTPTALATLDAEGVARYEFDLAWELPAGAVHTADTLAVHTGSIAAVLEPRVGRFLEAARSTATISYDPNIRPAVMPPRHELLPIVEHLVSLADVVKVSDQDLAWLEPDLSGERVAQRWLAAGPAIVVMTRAAEGAIGWCAAGQFVSPPSAMPLAVADTVGTGDAFTGALLWSLGTAGRLGADARRGLHGLDVAELGRHVTTATRAAELTVQRAGADPPNAAELEEYRRRHGE